MLASGLLLVVSCVVAADPAVTVRLQDQDTVNGKLLKIEPNRIQIQHGLKTTFFNNADFLEVGAIKEQAGRPWILLQSGEILVVDQISTSPSHIQAASLTWKQFQCPLVKVKAILLQPSQVFSARDALLNLAGKDHVTDRIVLPDGTHLSGELTFLAASRLQLLVTGFTEPLEFLLQNLSAILLAGNSLPLKKEIQVGFSDGSYGAAQKISRTGNQLVWQTVSGVRLETEIPFLSVDATDFDPWTQLCYYRPQQRTSMFLHDLTPSSYRYLSVLPGTVFNPEPPQYAAARNVVGGRLRCGKKSFLAGIGMVSVSRLSFKIPAGYTHFQSELCVDRRSGSKGSVTFHVLLQNSVGAKWQTVFDSQIVRGGDELRAISIPLKNARQLSLVVDMADQADILDYANWINARFVERP